MTAERVTMRSGDVAQPARLARLALAGLLAVMALGQASDLGGFTGVLHAYRLLPTDSGSAVVVVGSEGLAAALLLARTGAARRSGALVAIAVAAGWAVVGIQAFARGIPVHNCGCFGVHFAQPLRWWVLIEDVEFLALAWWVHRRLSEGSPQRQKTERSMVTATGTVIRRG